MISVVSVYHRPSMLQNILLEGLSRQTAHHEVILMDNTRGQWTSAASALNAGAKLAKGKYVMFLHQDVELASPSYLADAEVWLDSIPDLGIAGAIGMSPVGKSYQERIRGNVLNCGQDWGKPISRPEPVQTLDELMLVVPRESFQGFDEQTFDGWHCYGCDYALTMLEQGKGAYALPGYVYHRSLATNIVDLRVYHKRLFFKHRRHFPRIYATTNGLTWFNVMTIPELELALKVNRWLFPNWIDRVKAEVTGCGSLLDVGCGYNSPVQHLDVPKKAAVEVHEPYLVESRKKEIHQVYYQADVMQVGFQTGAFDVVFCSEVLEHLPHADGQVLLDRMERWAARRVVITVPNGWVPQGEYDGNPYQRHRSWWYASDFRRRGYRVTGMSGLKWIRGEQGVCMLKPELLGMRVAGASERLTRYVPEWDFQILAIKDMTRG